MEEVVWRVGGFVWLCGAQPNTATMILQKLSLAPKIKVENRTIFFESCVLVCGSRLGLGVSKLSAVFFKSGLREILYGIGGM